MEWSRDLRIANPSVANGLSRRRQRVTSLKDSTVDDREMELHEAVRSRDRERLQKKDRDREFLKRRRIDRYAKNGGDEEYLEDEEDARIHFLNRLNHPSLQSSYLSNNRRSLRTLRSSPVLSASVDETIGVPIPRRARSISIKRLHDSSNSSDGKLVVDLGHRRFPFSPATTASHICSGGTSPSAPGASMRKKMKSVEPRARALKSTTNPKPSSEIQDDIEIEVVEALFDLSQSSKNEEKFDKDNINTADDGLTKVGKDENKTFSLRYEKSIKVDSEIAMDDSMAEMKKNEEIVKEIIPNDSAPQLGDGFLNIEKVLSPKESELPSCVKVDAYEVQDPKVTKEDDTAIVVETKKEVTLEIDLMVPPPVTSSPDKDVLGDMAPFPKYMARDLLQKDGPVEALDHLQKIDLEKHYLDKSSVRDGGRRQLRVQKEKKNQLQTSLSPYEISLGGWPGVLPHPGYVAHLSEIRETILPMDDSSRFRIAKQHPKFTFSLPRPRRSATHQHIARSIEQHEQLITNCLLSGPTCVPTLCGTMPPTQRSISGSPVIGDCQGKPNSGAITVGGGKDEGAGVPSALNSTINKELMLQQASLHTTTNNFLHNPAFIFALGNHQTTVMAPAKSSAPDQSASASGSMSLRSNLAGGPSVNLPLPGEAFTSHSGPSMDSNEVAPYMALLQTNGCQNPISTNKAMPQLKGVQSPPSPLFNSSFYSSTMFSVSQSPKLPNTKIVDNNYHGLAAAHSTKAEKQQFPPSHPSSRHAPQSFSPSFGLNATSCPPLNFSSMGQNSANFPVLPDIAWNGYHMAKQKNFQTSDKKSVIDSAKVDDGLKRTLGKSETHDRKSSSNDVSPASMMGTSIVDELAGSVNFVPSVASGNEQSFPSSSVSETSGVLPILHQHHQQQQKRPIQCQKHHMQQMQQTRTSKINATTELA